MKKHLAIFYNNMIWWCFITSSSKFDYSLSTYEAEAINISSFSFLHIFILPIELHITNKKTFKIDRMKGVSKWNWFYITKSQKYAHNEKNSWIYIVTMCTLNISCALEDITIHKSMIHLKPWTYNDYLNQHV